MSRRAQITMSGDEVLATRTMIDRHAPKRIALQFAECRRATWDHRKLGEVY
jgi:hypothetical protein